MRLPQLGEVKSAKSAKQSFAPEFKPKSNSLRDTVVTMPQRRLVRSRGNAAAFHAPARMAEVRGLKSGSPALMAAARCSFNCSSVALVPR